MKKRILACIMCALQLSAFIQPIAWADIETIAAQYDFTSPIAENAVDSSTYVINPPLEKNHEYDRNYYIPAVNGGSSIRDLGTELALITKNPYTIEMWFKQDAECTNVERRLMSVADRNNIYLMPGINGKQVYIGLTYQQEVDGNTEYTIAFHKGDKSVKNGWNHIAFSIDKDAEVSERIKVVLNGEKVNIESTPVKANMSTVVDIAEKSIANITDDAKFFLNGTDRRVGWTYGGFPSNFQIGAFSVYKGAASNDELSMLMNKNADRYDETYDLFIKQNGYKAAFEDLQLLDEQYSVTAVLRLPEIKDVSADTVYLYDIVKNETDKNAQIMYNGSEYEITFSKPASDYELVIDKSVPVDGKNTYRNSDYRLPIKIAENDTFRNKVKSDILVAAQKVLIENPDFETLKDKLSEYKLFLNLDYTGYNQCIGTDKIIAKLAEYIVTNVNFDFADIKTQFEKISSEQIMIDFSDGVSELNEALKDETTDAGKFEEIVLKKYKNCFAVSEEKLKRYNALTDKNGVWKRLRSTEYDKDAAKAAIEKFLKDFENSVIEEEETEFFVEINAAEAEKLEQLLSEMSEKYVNLKIDLSDKNYQSNKNKVLSLLSERNLTPDNIKREFARCVASEALNSVAGGDRKAVADIILTYETYIDIPSVYKNGEKTEIHKYMIGKNYTPDNIEDVIKTSAEEYKRDKDKSNVRGGSGTGGSSSSTGNKSGSVIPGFTPSARGVEQIKKNEEVLKPSFSDLESVPWAEEGIIALAEKGIINGKSKNVFAPNDSITREEFIKIVVLAFGIKGDAEVNFVDVNADLWYAEYIKAAVANKIIEGMSETEFGIGKNITRQDMSVVLNHAMEKTGIKLETLLQEISFEDQDEIAEYAANDMLVLAKKGVLSGVDSGKIAPLDNTTRAQAAKVIYYILSNKLQ